MLVNATQAEELRVAMVDGQKLYDLSIEVPSREQKKANIYKARIARIEPSLEACFVDYGTQRHGFLPLKEVSREHFRQQPQNGRMNIRELLNEGQELMVQVEKEERGNKGAALTTFISLAGRFLVLMPNNPRGGGVSRRIEGEERDQMRETMAQLNVPEGMSAIIRTAGVGRSVEELQWDLDNLRTQWEAIDTAYKDRSGPFLVYQESDAVTRALRDYLGDDIGEILVDDQAAFGKAQEYMQRFMPADSQRKLKFYTDDIPLFTRFQIESQIESAYAHKVQLPSGGSLVIDYTEALVSIDINSARATRGTDIETTATNTNLEAADEIARQLRIRDIGGLIVIDFIDMEEGKNQRAVEDRLRDAVKMDRARIQIGRLSRFGLLEMSRQRLRPSLGESSHLVCPRCNGIGSIRGVESLALSILRLVGEDTRKERTSRVVVQVPVDVATYLINEKRDWLRALGDKSDTDIVIVPNPHIQTPEYSIRRIRDDEIGLAENTQVSYQIPQRPEVADPATAEKKPAAQAPAVLPLMPATSAPVTVTAPAAAPVAAGGQSGTRRRGLLGWIKELLVGEPTPAEGEPKHQGSPRRESHGGQRHDRDGRRDRGRGRGGERTSQPRRDGSRRPDGRRDESRPDEPRRDDSRRNSEPRHGEPRHAESRHGEPRREGGRKAPEARGSNAHATAPRTETPPVASETGPASEGGEHRERRSRRGGRGRRRRPGSGSPGSDLAATGASMSESSAPADNHSPAESSHAPQPTRSESVTSQLDFGSSPPAAAPSAPPPPAAPAASAPPPAESKPQIVWSSGPAQTSWRDDRQRED
jgi:ribonuclease E